MTEPLTEATRFRIITAAEQLIPRASDSLNTVIEARKSGKVESYPRAVVLNAVEFVLLLQHDLACLLNGLATHTRTFRGNLYSRLVLLVVHESSRTMKAIIAKDFRREIAVVLPQDAIETRLKTVHSDVCSLYNACESQFGAARDGIIAHRDRDADVRMALLRDIDEERVGQLAVRMLAITDTLMAILVRYAQLVYSEGRDAAT